MSEQLPSSKKDSSDEIDLGQLFDLIKKGFHKLGNVILRIFLFFRKYALTLIGLVLLGLAISFALNLIVSKKMKTEVIVRPNFDSKDYLYDVIEELNSNIISQNEDFISSMNFNSEELKGFEIEIEAIEEEEVENEDKVANRLKYLETLTNLKDQGFVIDILKTELTENTVNKHKITFLYSDNIKGTRIVEKLLDYLNTNAYLNGVKEISAKNAKSRIENNKNLIAQIDVLVDNYSTVMLRDDSKSGNSTFSFEKENSLNVPSLLGIKNNLLKEVEEKNVELIEQSTVINIINLGKEQAVMKRFFSDRKFQIPMALVVGFLVFVFYRYLNRKANEIDD